MAGDIEFRVLGALEATREGDQIALGGVKQRTVLGVLLLSPTQVVSVDRIIQAVWGEDAAPSAAKTLQVYLSKLRSALNPQRRPADELIMTAPPGYRAQVNPQNLDLLRFDDIVERARAMTAAGRSAEAVSLYRDALALWRGEVLADLIGTSSVIDRESERMELERMTVQSECLDAELAVSRHRRVLPEIARLVERSPLDERLRGQLMIALYRSGRHTEALRTYKELTSVLNEELGLEPGPELQQLEERILMQDPSLLKASVSEPAITATIRQQRETLTPAWLELGADRFNLDRAVTTIGRSPERNIVLDDPTVSRRHAEIRRTRRRVTIVDVGSTNGISVNGIEHIEADLAPEDVLRVGDIELVFRFEPTED